MYVCVGVVLFVQTEVSYLLIVDIDSKDFGRICYTHESMYIVLASHVMCVCVIM